MKHSDQTTLDDTLDRAVLDAQAALMRMGSFTPRVTPDVQARLARRERADLMVLMRGAQAFLGLMGISVALVVLSPLLGWALGIKWGAIVAAAASWSQGILSLWLWIGPPMAVWWNIARKFVDPGHTAAFTIADTIDATAAAAALHRQGAANNSGIVVAVCAYHPRIQEGIRIAAQAYIDNTIADRQAVMDATVAEYTTENKQLRASLAVLTADPSWRDRSKG